MTIILPLLLFLLAAALFGAVKLGVVSNRTLQALANIGAIVAQISIVGISVKTGKVSVVLSLAAVLGALFGARLTRFLNEEIFRKLIMGVLVLTGFYLTISSIFF